MSTRSGRAWAAMVALVAAFALMSAPAQAGVANAGIAGAPASDPLAGMRWGTYTGSLDDAFPTYSQASGENKRLLGVIALRPRAHWFGNWYPDNQVGTITHNYIANATGGDPNVMSQMTVFRLTPWEGNACKALPSADQQASFKAWINNAASGIGGSRMALILQPDLPEASCIPHHSKLPLQLVAYAAKVFGSLPHTTVYIDAGAADWAKPSRVAGYLRDAGVAFARGFALNITHYDSTTRQIFYGQKLVGALKRIRLSGKHFVINTDSNGHPFTYQQWARSKPWSFFEPGICSSAHARGLCMTLGIPPTTDVANSKWGLGKAARGVAKRLVDAYMWIGRPWLKGQVDPFEADRAEQMARSTPF